jgi:hypothetical protein
MFTQTALFGGVDQIKNVVWANMPNLSPKVQTWVIDLTGNDPLCNLLQNQIVLKFLKYLNSTLSENISSPRGAAET